MAKQQQKLVASYPWTKRLCEGGFILISTLALFILLALITYRVSDPGFFHVTRANHLLVLNAGGRVGAYTADLLYTLLGYASYGLPLALAYLAWVVLHDHRTLGVVSKPMLALRIVGVVLLLVGSCGLLVFSMAGTALRHQPGGVFGQIIATFFHQVLNSEGALLCLLATALVGITWLTGLSWVRVTEIIGRYVIKACWMSIIGLRRAGYAMYQAGCVLFRQILTWITALKARHAMPKKQEKVLEQVLERPKAKRFEILPPKIIKPTVVPVAAKPSKPPEAPVFSSKFAADKAEVTGVLPALDLLAQPSEAPVEGYSNQALETLSHELEQHLIDFGIQANVVAAHPGPVITRFELQLAAGVKVSKLSALSKDLARSLSVTSVRVVEIIPGKAVVGLELPNPKRAMVVLSEVLSSDVYQQAQSPLTLALGVDIAGHPMVVDLAKMPHLLVAGTTGSGKSVGINAMILSLLFKSTPEQVRLILIDPKMLELSVYDGIPHLLTPVVTDMKEAASALRWCVQEMERRYRLMAALGVRNLAGFNAKVSDAIAREMPLTDPLWKPTDSMAEKAPELSVLPYVVVVIDELADMMMVVGKKVEQL
ncbi:MAG: DNA translocase FtsK 4TM domain-containing protein, partial [Legionella sp.]|nr:DNA translocase FtsK 4TM domain-containing protein [Legionella sp.]